MAFIIGLVGAIAGVAGSGMQNEAAIKQGKQAEAFKRDQATAVRAEAGELMLAERETKERIISRATALAAAGGGSVSDPTTQKILGDIEGEGQYREMLHLYNGERQAKLLLREGAALKQEGRDRADAYGAQGIASALKGASSLYGAYNQSRIDNVGTTNTASVVNGTVNGIPAVSSGRSYYTPQRLR